MPHKIELLEFSEVAGKNIPCTRGGFPHQSVFGAALFCRFSTEKSAEAKAPLIALTLRGGKQLKVIVTAAEVIGPHFMEHFRYKCIAIMQGFDGKDLRVSGIEVSQFTGDAGRRVCYVKFPENP